MRVFKILALFMAIALLLISSPDFISAQDEDAEYDDAAYEALLEKGKEYYNARCEACHGADGDGKGFVDIIRVSEKNGRVLEIYPRDFTVGVYKFRSTATGCLPDDKDLMGTVKRGITKSLMPPQDNISSEETEAVVEYVKSFSERYEEEDPCDQISVADPPVWVASEKSIEKGKKIYKDMKCWECHGDLGKGDGPKSNDITDDWGKRLLPFNFVTGELKRGSTAENVYMTFTAGLDGTGMPSYQDTLNEEDRWHLVSYTLKLMGLTESDKKTASH